MPYLMRDRLLTIRLQELSLLKASFPIYIYIYIMGPYPKDWGLHWPSLSIPNHYLKGVGSYRSLVSSFGEYFLGYGEFQAERGILMMCLIEVRCFRSLQYRYIRRSSMVPFILGRGSLNLSGWGSRSHIYCFITQSMKQIMWCFGWVPA